MRNEVPNPGRSKPMRGPTRITSMLAVAVMTITLRETASLHVRGRGDGNVEERRTELPSESFRCVRPPLLSGIGIGPSWKKVPLDLFLACSALRLAR